MVLGTALGFLSSVAGIDAESRFDTTAPRTPQGLNVTLGNGKTELTWNENGEWDLFSYVLLVREAQEKEASTNLLTGKTDTYILDDLEPKRQYFVSLAARDISGNLSAPSPEIGFQSPSESKGEVSVHTWIPASADRVDAMLAFEENKELFTSVSPFIYALEPDGSISKRGTIFSEDEQKKTQDTGTEVIPTITNNFDKDKKGTELLKDTEKTKRHIDLILSEVEKSNYDGIDIDYENLSPEVKDAFTSFIATLSSKLHEKGKTLSVTVQAKRGDDQNWDGVGASDYEKLGEVADSVRIMTYDYSRLNTPPGPIAPRTWFRDVYTYAVSKIPAEKIVAGVPSYGYKWCTKSVNDSCESTGLVWTGVQNIIKKHQPLVEWNNEAASPWFMYTDEAGNTYVVNFENHQSLSAKLAVVKELGLSGVVIWRLGNEDPENYRVIKEKLTPQTVLPSEVLVEGKDKEIYLSWDKPKRTQVTGYRIEYESKSTEKRFVDILDENEYTIPALMNNEQYTVTVSPISSTHDVLSDEMYGEAQPSSKLIFTVTPKDLRYPGDIPDLSIDTIDTQSVDVSFSAPGDEYFEGTVSEFDIRYSKDTITEENFNEARKLSNVPKPVNPHEVVNWQLKGLESGISYTIAVKAIDEAGNASNMSNVVFARTIDIVPPKAPEVATILPKDKSVEVIWKANNEPDLAGYNLYFKREKEAYSEFSVSKDKNHFVIPDLDNNRTYSVALVAFDGNGNESHRSEVKEAVPRADNSLTRLSEEMLLEKEKISGTLYLFGQKVFNEKALPYVAMISVVVVNIFIYYSFKNEILRLLKGSAHAAEVTHAPLVVRRQKITDLKRKGRKRVV